MLLPIMGHKDGENCGKVEVVPYNEDWPSIEVIYAHLNKCDSPVLSF